MQIRILFLSSLLLLAITGLSAQTDYTISELLGKFDPSVHGSFVRIDDRYTTKKDIYLRAEAYAAFVRMAEAAQKEGHRLLILSATRNFAHQELIWKKKWALSKYSGWEACEKVKDIMKFSSLPGTSRHHWGTDIDLNALDNAYFNSGDGLALYHWLVKNAASYGFYQTYTSKDSGRTGYEEEKWHWSYFPLAASMQKAYTEKVKYSDLHGIPGAECAEEMELIKKFVEGVASPPAVN